MPLIQCKDCGKEISDKAERCPNCGCPVENLIIESYGTGIEKETSFDNETILKDASTTASIVYEDGITEEMIIKECSKKIFKLKNTNGVKEYVKNNYDLNEEDSSKIANKVMLKLCTICFLAILGISFLVIAFLAAIGVGTLKEKDFIGTKWVVERSEYIGILQRERVHRIYYEFNNNGTVKITGYTVGEYLKGDGESYYSKWYCESSWLYITSEIGSVKTTYMYEYDEENDELVEIKVTMNDSTYASKEKDRDRLKRVK